MKRRYVLITPCRDEAEFICRTIDTIVAQTMLPEKWIIVDDGSTDDTPLILAEACEKYPFIEVIQRDDRGGRSVGPGVIEAFYAGLESIDLGKYDFIGKIDADLEFPPEYFQRVMERFEADPYLGNFSGKPYLRINGRLAYERFGDENAVGAAKFYRIACFQDIGGFVRQAGWDGIDGHMCRLRGWVASSEDADDVRFVHLRLMGSSQKSVWVGRKRWGRGKYYMGSALYYIAAVALYRMIERPFVVGGFGVFWGYIQAMLKREPRFDDKAYLRYFRKYELRSLLFGKRRTMQRYHDEIRRS